MKLLIQESRQWLSLERKVITGRAHAGSILFFDLDHSVMTFFYSYLTGCSCFLYAIKKREVSEKTRRRPSLTLQLYLFPAL